MFHWSRKGDKSFQVKKQLKKTNSVLKKLKEPKFAFKFHAINDT